MVVKETFDTDNEILIAPQTARRNGCLVSKTGVVVNSDGEYVVKAGTPLYGVDAGMNRETALTVAATGTGDTASKPQGILYRDVKFVGTATKANGVLVIDGEVDYEKLDSTVQPLITSAVKTALPNIQFTKGRKD